MPKLKWKRVESGIYETTHNGLTFRVEKVPTAVLYGPNWKASCQQLGWKQHWGSKKDCCEEVVDKIKEISEN